MVMLGDGIERLFIKVINYITAAATLSGFKYHQLQLRPGLGDAGFSTDLHFRIEEQGVVLGV